MAEYISTLGLWLEGIQLKLEANNKFNVLPIRLWFINVCTYPNPKPTPYNNAKTVIIVVQWDKNYAILMCTCPVDESVYHLALTLKGTYYYLKCIVSKVSTFWNNSSPRTAFVPFFLRVQLTENVLRTFFPQYS